MLGLADQAVRRRRVGLTPMIDVVFLLLVFFMLAARFGTPGAVTLTAAGGGGAVYDGPPRLVELTGDGIRLNGVAVTQAALPAALAPLMTDPGDVVLLRPRDGATVQALVALSDTLRDAGLTHLAVIP